MSRRTFCGWSSHTGVMHALANTRHHSKRLIAIWPSPTQERVQRRNCAALSRAARWTDQTR